MTTALFMALLASVGLGALLGALGGLLGIGGAIIAIPVLVFGYGMDQQMAQGTALVMMVPNVLIAFWRYRQRNPFPLRTALAIGLASIVSTYPAARLAVALDAHTLKLSFAIFLLWLAGYFFWTSRERAEGQERAPGAGWSERYLPAVGVFGGLFAGLFSVGAGIIATPIFVRGFGKRQAVAQGLALALVVPGAMVALATYSRARHVDWPIGMALAAGGMATVTWGVALAHRLPERRLKQLFGLMVLATALLMLRPM